MEEAGNNDVAEGKNMENIIKTEEPQNIPLVALGVQFFRSMKYYKNNIAQYIVETDEVETYHSLLKKCIRTSLKLKSCGITQDDVVCLCTYNHADSCVPFISANFLGIKVASLDPTLSVDDTAHLLQQVKPAVIFLVPESIELIEESMEKAGISARLVIFGESEHEHLEEFSDYTNWKDDDEDQFEPVRMDANETAVIFFSSGTTGLPKGICQHSYGLICQAITGVNHGLEGSVRLYYSSLYWISSALFLTSAIISGTARVVCKFFNPQEVWELIDKYKVSSIFLAPNQAVEMIKEGRPDGLDTTSLMVLLTGGGALPTRQLNALRELLPGTFVCQAYGQTEVAGILTLFNMKSPKDTLLLHYRPHSCGKPIPGIWYKIVDPETGNILGPNEQGELFIKTKFSMNGYYNMDASESYDSQGWLKTGDIVYYDEDLCFYVVDRSKEMLKYKSWHVAPATLEGVLQSHPAVRKVVVIGIPHDEDGDHPMALVMLDQGADVPEDELENYVAERVQDRQKLRGGVKFVDHFIMTPSGKVKRQEMRRKVLAGEI